jgi:hypothetical protein
MATGARKWRVGLTGGMIITAIGFGLGSHAIVTPGVALLWSVGLPFLALLQALNLPVPPIALVVVACVVFWTLAVVVVSYVWKMVARFTGSRA